MTTRYEILDRALAAGVLPDPVLRAGTRHRAAIRIREAARGGLDAERARLADLVAHMSTGPLAEETIAANEQHYELPAEFFGLFLGRHRKYSSCWWPDGVETLDAAEEAMLQLTCERAGVEEGMTALDLGCGWGSLSFWLVERCGVRVTAVSNSHRQREWIEAERDRRGLGDRLEVLTADINSLTLERTFDRVISVEMFEHMRNWSALLARVSGWLTPQGKAFVHVFSHRRFAYQFQGTWAAQRFFAGGTMPSHDLLLRFDEDLLVTKDWRIDGTHYARTLEAWLDRLDRRSDEATSILRHSRPEQEARQLLATWRLFLIATAELWGYRAGTEWTVSHYLLERRRGHGTNPLVVDT